MYFRWNNIEKNDDALTSHFPFTCKLLVTAPGKENERNGKSRELALLVPSSGKKGMESTAAALWNAFGFASSFTICVGLEPALPGIG